jgi:hypothetical protein
VIYTGDDVPALVEGESEMIWNKTPLQVTLDPNCEALQPASRLHISRILTIDHDIPVAKLGKISPREVERLRQYSGLSILEEKDQEECEQENN